MLVGLRLSRIHFLSLGSPPVSCYDSYRLVQLLKLKEETPGLQKWLKAPELHFMWTSDLLAANINKAERLTDKEELCRKLQPSISLSCLQAPLTSQPVTPSEILQCHCHRGHSPLIPLTNDGSLRRPPSTQRQMCQRDSDYWGQVGTMYINEDKDKEVDNVAEEKLSHWGSQRVTALCFHSPLIWTFPPPDRLTTALS